MIEQLSSKNQRILVFADPHQEIDKVSNILKREQADKVVCLGDWFDSFHLENVRYSIKTAAYLQKLVFQPNFLTLFGNHDVHYFWGKNEHALCSGWTKDKDKAIIGAFEGKMAEVRDKFQWFVWIDDYLCTHAGVHPYHFPPMLEADKKGISTWLKKAGEHAELSLASGGSHWFFRAGEARGGSQRIGGIVWADFDDEFEPIDGVKQLVGHTYHRRAVTHYSNRNLARAEANDLDIDCNLTEYLIIHNGKLEIKSYYDL
jgi:hypothetical protein